MLNIENGFVFLVREIIQSTMFRQNKYEMRFFVQSVSRTTLFSEIFCPRKWEEVN